MAESSSRTSVNLGLGGLVAGVLSAFGSFMIYATSTFLNPPDWLRLPTMALFPLGVLASLVLGGMALRGKGRGLAMAGWVAAFAGIGLFIFAIATLG